MTTTTPTITASNNGVKSLNGAKPAIMNMPETVQTRILKSAYKNIAEVNALIEKFMPGYLEKKKFFEEVQAEFLEQDKQLKSLEKDLAEEKLVVTTLKHFKGLPEDNRVMVGVSKPATNGFSSSKKVQWLPAEIEILQTVNRFLSGSELWELLGKNENLVADAEKTQTGFKKSKSAVLINLKIHALSPKGKKQVIMYQEKFGLPEWLDAKGSLVNPQHVKEFMYK